MSLGGSSVLAEQPELEDSQVDYAEIVRQLAAGAVAEFGTADDLAAALAEAGVKRYSDNAVTAWTRGETMPPGHVLLALVKVSGQSVDDLLGITDERIETLTQLLDQAIAGLRRIEARMGMTGQERQVLARILDNAIHGIGQAPNRRRRRRRGSSGTPPPPT